MSAEAAVAAPPAAAPSLQDAIAAQHSTTAPAPPAPKEQAPPKQEAKQPEQKVAKTEQPAKTEKKQTVTLKGLDALPEMGKEEVEPGEEKPAENQEQPTAPEPPEEAPKGMTQEAQKAWEQYKKGYKEAQRLKPEVETLRKELAALKEKPAIPPEVDTELSELRQFRAAFDVVNTEDYKAAVTTPMAQQWEIVSEVVAFSGIDSTKLERAMREPNRLQRNEAIRAALSESEKEVDQQSITEVCNAATEIHKLDAKGRELEQKAVSMQNVIKGKREQETQKEQQERESAFAKASDETFRALNTKLPEFLKEKEVAEAVKTARIAEDPMDQSYQAQAGVILPSIVKALQAARTEIATLKKQAAARAQAKPSIDGKTAAPMGTEQPISLTEAILAHNSGAR